MPPAAPQHEHVTFVKLARTLAGASVAITAVAFLGHMANRPSLYSLHPGYQAMSLITAPGLACAALSLLAAMRDEQRRASRLALVLAGVGALMGCLVIGSHLLRGEDVLDPMLATALGLGAQTSGRTSFSSAVAIVLLALAAALRCRVVQAWIDALVAICLSVALLAVASYAYSSTDLYALPLFRTMALNTAITILLLSCAHLFSQSRAGWGATIAAPGDAGKSTRRQLLFLAIPPVAGWVIVQVANAGYLRLGSALAILVAVTVAPLMWLILRDGRALAVLAQERAEREAADSSHRADLEEQLADQALVLEEKSQTRLLAAKRATLESEGRYRTLFDSIDAGFCVVEMRFDDQGNPADYRFLEVNSAFATHTGLRRPEGRWMRHLVPDHEQHWFDIYGKVALSGESVRFENPAKALNDRWYDVHAFRVDDPARHHVGILFNDVTDRRRAEEALRYMNATLEQRVAAAMAEREAAQAALRQSQKMEALGQLTGGVAHDFNNLLTPIVGTLDLLDRRAALTDREKRMLEGALQSADRAKTLVQRLLAFARRQPLQIGPVDVGTLVAGMADLVAGTIGRQVTLVVEAQADLPPAQADAHQLEMAILNLCVNARDAMPDGGTLTLAASAATPPAALDLPDGAFICLTVADTGMGMGAETLKRAVEPFYSTKGVGKGTGLGLSMVDGLAAQLNGTLDIRSTPGLGTRVDLWLPVSQSAVDHYAPTKPAATPSGEAMKGRALVIDDDIMVRVTTAHMLAELGFHTVELGNAREALALLLEESAFDLVVTDHMMPGMTGADLATALREMRPHLPVLLVSGYADVADVAPNIPRLAKPFRQNDLKLAIGRLSMATRS